MIPRIATSRQLLRLAQKRQPAPAAALFSRTLSTTSPLRSATQPQPPPEQQPTSPPTPRKPARKWLHAAIFLLLGSTAGAGLHQLIIPPSPPAPETEEDTYTTQVLHAQASKLPIVKELDADPAWESWDAYDSLTPEHKAQHIMAGAMRGSRGVGGYQRIFHNAGTGEFISVVYFGTSTTGWPGVVHGGLLATLLDESCGRAAFKQWGGRSGVTANLTLEYKKATLANDFYVLRVKSRSEEELPEGERGKRQYKSHVDGTIEFASTGAVTVRAKALFVGGEGKGAKPEKGAVVLPKWGLPGKEENLKF
ncbi:hypothetical protein OQA88_4737 [Cercophora sp. LCS_1]